MPDHQTAVESLLTDWIEAKHSLIWEFSGEIEKDTRALLSEAAERCETLGITWGLWLVPENINNEVDEWDRQREDNT